MPEKFIINGENKLKGEIEARGAKNVAFPVLVASLLTDQDCIIDNLPLIEDVFKIIEIIKSMDVDVQWIGTRKVKINAKNINPSKIKKELVSKLRGSISLFGALLARFHKANLPQPGGCVIGSRPITTHLDAFKQLGISVTPETNSFSLKIDNPKPATVILNEFSVSATLNVLIYASLVEGETTIKIADQDYQTQELAKVLNKMGASIKIHPFNTITVKGAKKLKGFNYKLIYDPIEAGTFILLAGATKSNLIVKNVEIELLDLVLKKLKDFGLIFKQLDKSTIEVMPSHNVKIEKVQALPYPGMSTDLLPLFGVWATQTEGMTLLHDPLYEGRLKYLEELNKMGANIIFSDPHRAIIPGPTPLYGVEINSPDLRGGASLIVGALVAKGETVINNIYQIDRGYEKIEERLQKIGADIKRVS